MEGIVVMPAGDLRRMMDDVVSEALARYSPATSAAAAIDDPLMCGEDVQRRLNISRTTLWRLEKEGAIASVRVGRLLRFRRSSVDRYEANRASKQAA